MLMKKDLPISHKQIKKLTQEKSRSPTVERASASTDDAARTQQGETQNAPDDWYPHGSSTITFGNLMLTWRKAAYKKKDKITGAYLYQYSNWPICERFRWEPDYAESCSAMSRQYFNCDFTWDMAVEADRLAFRLEQSERKGKSKGKGKPE